MAVSLAGGAAVAQASATIEQCANGPEGNRDCEWVTGNLNSNRSRYREGDFVPFRVTIDRLQAGHDYTLRIGYDAVEGGLNAYDYVGSYDASRRPGQAIVPCYGVAGVPGCAHSPSTNAVPVDTETHFPSGTQLHGVFSAWGATFTHAAYDPPSPRIDSSTLATGATIERRIDLTFRAEGQVAVLAWGGHVASILNWGPGRTFAEAGSGSPFHMRLKNAGSFNPGSQDLSLQVGVIAPRPSPFTTAVQPASVTVGSPVIDTAQLGGSPPPTGSVRFFVCGPAPAGPPDCTLGGTSVGHDEVLTQGGTAAVQFVPQAEGFYCFRAEFRPSDLAVYSPAAHTDLTSECFSATAAPPPPPPPPTTLTVIKLCVPADDSGSFTLAIVGEGHTIRKTLRCGQDTGAIEVAPGTYRVTEHSAGSSYTQTIGGDCERDGTVQIAQGDAATCEISNVRHTAPPQVAELTVLKLCAPGTDRGRFTFTIDGVTVHDLQCDGRVGPLALAPGTHRVSETAGTGTDLSAYTTVIGGACQADGSIALTAGESATCAITNIRSGTPTAVLTVVKQCVPPGDSGRFVVDINEDELGEMRCGQSTGPITLAAGVHLVGEVATSSGFGDDFEVAFGGDCAATGILTLAPGQQATCSVTNTRIHHARPPRPPSVCYALSASPRVLRAGQAASVVARVALRGQPVRDALVRLSGAGISRARRTRADGAARFDLLPSATGTINVTTPRQFGCPAATPARLSVRGASAPHVTG